MVLYINYIALAINPSAAVGPGGGAGGRPPRGLGGRGGGRLGSGHPQTIIQSPDGLYKAPKQYTKPQKRSTKPRQTIESPKDFTKPNKYYTKPRNIKQNR